MDIIEMTTANTSSDMNAAVNTETSSGKSLEMLPQFTVTKTSNQSKKLYNLKHISKLQGGQRELEAEFTWSGFFSKGTA